jgi:hypothetical protein
MQKSGISPYGICFAYLKAWTLYLSPKEVKKSMRRLIPGCITPKTRSPFLLLTAVLLLAAAVLFAQVPQAQANNFGKCCTNGREFHLYLSYNQVGGMICNWQMELAEFKGQSGQLIWHFGPTYSCTSASESAVFDGEIKASVSKYLQSIQVNGCSNPSDWLGVSCQ